ncbi:hypothetical protein A3J77_00170 [Candidatus Wolfebacteria bacterium RBG_13_41_7]|uniref:STAS domain-containing protein n=1 Tax=Candidatus Wolfebacteria bacterium RBG_13_41_7 TaxID=1802554 RepID=A0A1F8DQL8_9BACT|nr:MAG: hypothetical protein A3J77_00170 [Candidatus Wolfebacteria bacterium RBG_13_41_7]
MSSCSFFLFRLICSFRHKLNIKHKGLKIKFIGKNSPQVINTLRTLAVFDLSPDLNKIKK